MTHKIELLPGEPILVTSLPPDYSMSRDGARLLDEAREVLDTMTAPVYSIVDLSQVTFTLDDLIGSANRGARSEKALTHHPMVRETVFVSTHPAIRLAVKGLATPLFGSTRAHASDTVEEALAYVRAQLSVA